MVPSSTSLITPNRTSLSCTIRPVHLDLPSLVSSWPPRLPENLALSLSKRIMGILSRLHLLIDMFLLRQGLVIESSPAKDPYNAIDANLVYNGTSWHLTWGSWWKGKLFGPAR